MTAGPRTDREDAEQLLAGAAVAGAAVAGAAVAGAAVEWSVDEVRAAQPCPPRAAPRRWLPWPRSLNARLVAGVVALVLVLVVAIGTSTYYALSSFLYNRLDKQLATTSSERSLVSLLSPPQRMRLGGIQVPQTVFVTLISDTTGLPTSNQPSGADLSALRLPSSTYRSLSKRSTSVQTRTTLDGEQIRMVTVTGLQQQVTDLTTGAVISSEPVTVAIGLSEADVDRILRRTVRVEFFIGLAALLLAFGATTFGVRRSLRNLYKVTGTAREVTAELSPEGAGLDRRVPVVEGGTEVGQLAESVNTLLSAVETQFAARVESEERMRQFMADASHELRTPLTSIRGYAELARMQRAAGDAAEDNLDRIESEGTRMSRLVEDLLLLARGDAAANEGRHDHGPVEIVSMIDDVASASRAAFPDRRIELVPAPVPLVLGDRDQLLRVVRNLVTNACVHTRPDAPVVLRCQPSAGGAEIQVVDGGPGLSPEDAAHVFERFWRADKARTRARGGSGLGMSIVATIIRAHGGSVRFDSAVESGSTVTVWLPAMPADAPWTTT